MNNREKFRNIENVLQECDINYSYCHNCIKLYGELGEPDNYILPLGHLSFGLLDRETDTLTTFSETSLCKMFRDYAEQ